MNTIKKTVEIQLFSIRKPFIRRRPTFPGGLPPSIISAEELNFRVRDGNGWGLSAIATEMIS